jgi:hypothetical protein
MLNTKLQWIVGILTCVLVTSYFHSGKKIDGVIWSDQEGYYVYLPSLFITGFDKAACTSGCNMVETEDGPLVFTKYTYGVSLLQSPFFLAAHLIAPMLGFERDGRTLPYIWGNMLAAIFYMLAGLAFLGRLLRELKFESKIIWIVGVLLLAGSNLFYYTFREAGMSHVFSFFLLSVLVFGSNRMHRNSGSKWSVISGIVLALIVLIRPTNAIAVLVPVLWGANVRDIPSRILATMKNYRFMFAGLIAAAILFTPQLLYWKMVTGNYLFYSYGNEGFTNWNNPKMLQVLLSPQNGWLVYSPVMILGLIGIGSMMKQRTQGWLMPTVTLLLATYIFGSWWAWWFGGAYGHRCYVDFLPLLAVPMAVLVSSISENKQLFYTLAAICLVLIFINIRMSDIYEGMWDGPNWGWNNYLGKLKQVFYL